MVITNSGLFSFVDIYSLCNFYDDTEGIEFNLTKIDKNKSDASSRWAIIAIKPNNVTHNFFLNNLCKEEVENNFENLLEEIKG